MQLDLSIIIVSYNTCSITQNCIQSIYNQNLNIEYEIILIDNHSNDNTVYIIKQIFPEVIIIENLENKMFSKANNQGIQISKGKYVLLLNSDTLFLDSSIEKMIHYMELNNNCVCTGPRVLNEDLSFQSEGYPLSSIFHTIVNSLFYMNRWPLLDNFKKWFLPAGTKGVEIGKIREVGWVSGCFMLIKANILNSVGRLNEQIFFYGEEIEWCFRAKSNGFDVFVIPTATIVHLGGKSTKGDIAKIVNERNNMVEGYLNLQKLTIGHFKTFIMSSIIVIKIILILIFYFFSFNKQKLKSYFSAFKYELEILVKILIFNILTKINSMNR